MKDRAPFDLSGRALALCAALAFTACSSAVVPPPANNLAGPGLFTATVRVTNTSATCAWVTIYFATFYKPWIIAGLPNNRPRFVHKGGYYDFGDIIFEQLIPPATIPGEIKVRAEFTKNADCTGGTIADESAQNKGILPDGGTLGLYASVYSTLSGSSGRYSVSTPQHQQ